MIRRFSLSLGRSGPVLLLDSFSSSRSWNLQAPKTTAKVIRASVSFALLSSRLLNPRRTLCLCWAPSTMGSGLVRGYLLVLLQGHASMTHRVQRSYGHRWDGKADHLAVIAVLRPWHPFFVGRCAFGVFVIGLSLESGAFGTC